MTSNKIAIPVIAIVQSEKDLLEVLLPTDALIILRSIKHTDKPVFIKEGNLVVSMQKIVDYLIAQDGFFEALDIAIDSEPQDRVIARLLAAAKKQPEN